MWRVFTGLEQGAEWHSQCRVRMSRLFAGVSPASTSRPVSTFVRAAMRGEASKDAARTIVLVGDVHGHATKLRRLFRNLRTRLGSKRLDKATVVFLGDLCDRGPDTKGVFEFIASELPEKHPAMDVRVLAGNHDFAMGCFVRATAGGVAADDWTNSRRPEPPLWRDDRGDTHVNMHLQGRRWGGTAEDSANAFESERTFHSYGVDAGDREKLLAALPEKHKALLASMEFVVEIDGVSDDDNPKVDALIAVHAGLESDVPVNEQLVALRTKVETTQWVEGLQGRANVLPAHPELPENVLVVSGHHGFVKLDKNRIIVDGCAGHEDRPLTAVVLPERALVDDSS